MHKIAQKVTSVALAASMLLSMFAVNTVAFADEFKDNTTVSDEVTEAPVSDDEVDAVESVDKTDTSNSESEDTPVESPEPSQTVTDVVDLTHDSTADTARMIRQIRKTSSIRSPIPPRMSLPHRKQLSRSSAF